MCDTAGGFSKLPSSVRSENMDVVKEAEQNEELRVVWINEERKIASFHAVDGYVVQTFVNHDFFMNYIHSLQERSFRFQ